MIDLFAGCGGVSAPVFVNELNDDARQTYLINRTHELGGKPFTATLPYLASADVNWAAVSGLFGYRASNHLYERMADVVEFSFLKTSGGCFQLDGLQTATRAKSGAMWSTDTKSWVVRFVGNWFWRVTMECPRTALAS
jgi:hypothetical protein